MKRVSLLGLRPAGYLALAALGLGMLAEAQTTPAAPAQTRNNISASSYIALGNLYYSKGQYDSAYVAFRAASENDPRSTEALLGLGRSQTRLRLYAPAIETLRRLVGMDARNFSAHLALSQSYVAQYVGTTDRAAVAGNLDEALKVLGEAEVLQNDSAVLWNERSIIYKLKGDYARAIEMSRRASTIDPNDSVILYNLGDLYQASGNSAMALESLQKAVIADPTDAQARAYYGKLLLLSGNPNAARLELAQAERLAPNNAYAVGQYGVYGYLTKDNTLARIKLTQALKLDPLRYPEFYYYLGRLEMDSGLVKEAKADFTKAAALASTNSEYFYWLGRAQEASGDKGAARLAYGQALSLNPNMKVAQDGLSRVK
ncbi:tetratricopeptide repeat protein [Deinococcus peraridilitoris]|uniref:tetratricopeptide repeat protein n=1 Tax=Deinococcus peraridilitoris TaxID=432329 RepID=UPI001FE02994|nr:tetratricopeptide repeat protein [Deinococcus peraridilitoris]